MPRYDFKNRRWWRDSEPVPTTAWCAGCQSVRVVEKGDVCLSCAANDSPNEPRAA